MLDTKAKIQGKTKPIKEKCCVATVFLFVLLFFCSFSLCYGQEKDTSSVQESKENENGAMHYVMWPFVNVLQPLLNGLVYPVSAPLHYLFDNGIVEKGVDLITFGSERNIMVYPVMNLKPGTSTLIGASYRHRNIWLDHDYLVAQIDYYANSDIYFTTRYSKQNVFNLPFFLALRFNLTMDRDDSYILPCTKDAFIHTDSTMSFELRGGVPLNTSKTLNLQMGTTVKWVYYDLPDIQDSILLDDKYPAEDRGQYQNSLQYPLNVTLIYDNLDFPYAPSRGTRFALRGTYNFVSEYSTLDLSHLEGDFEFENPKIKDGGKNHDFVKTELYFQHYFLLGKTDKFILSATEAKKSRRFYTDFSLDEALRVWRPENVRETLFERRVLAFQYRLISVWEMEDGGAPSNAFPMLNARFPLRGYGDAWTANHVMGLSAEYRWPIDRFVDGVVFDEYALFTEEFDDWSFDRFVNSYGFGVRVRRPDLFLFRFQLGFHGSHGISLIMTIAPEFQ
ncbi:MAG: BamA/TamA family outer membrane protein [Fibrobacteraceae bacterium]|nr:BamA/TamA family outer membrane protein [Fibrobacteraceae bacterium]